MIVLLFALAAAVTPAPPAVTVVVGATLLDGGGREPVADSVVVLRGTAIAAVGDRMRTPIPKGAVLIDGRRLWITPAPASAVGRAALLPAIADVLSGPDARVLPGRPAHLALFDADPRREGRVPGLRRLWLAGKVREIAPEAPR